MKMSSLEAKIRIINFSSIIQYFDATEVSTPNWPDRKGRPTQPEIAYIQ